MKAKTFNEYKVLKGISDKFFEEASEAQKAEVFAGYQAHIMDEVYSLLEQKSDTDAVKEIKTALSELKALKDVISKEDFDLMKSELVEAKNELKALKEKGVNISTNKSLREMLSENAEALKTLKESKKEAFKIEYKAVGTITTGNVTPTVAGGISVILNDPEAGISPFNRTRPFFAQLFPTSGTSGNTISYAEMVTPEGGAAMTAEGSLKSQADFNIAEKTSPVKKATAFIKTSREALSDIDALAGEIENELMTLVELKVDSQVLSGDGIGQNLLGVTPQAQAFSAGDFAGTITAPNEYDVLNVAISQIETAEVISGEPAGFMPNVIVLNPIDVKKMKLVKSTTGEYVFPMPMVGGDGTSIEGVPVISNPRMPKGYFLVMDSSKGTLRIRENFTLSMAYENDDFTKNLITILGEKRVAFYIKSQNVKAFVYGTFATAKDDLEAV